VNLDTSTEEKILRRIPAEIAAASLILAVPTGFLFGPGVAGLFFLGGVLASLSFLSLKRWLFKASLGDRKRAIVSFVGFYVLRLILIGAVFSTIILLYKRKAIASAAGFSVLILVLFAEALVAVARKPTWKS
jgi:hypothetical protein